MKTIFSLLSLLCLQGCMDLSKIEKKAEVINNYHQTALALAKENRTLLAKQGELQSEINKLQSEKKYLTLKLSKLTGEQDSEKKSKEKSNPLTSFQKEVETDYVNYNTYLWDANKLYSFADEYLEKEQYEHAAQYYYYALHAFPADERNNDFSLYKAGISSFKSDHFNWAKKFLDQLVKRYPHSEHFRSAKLWLGLIYFKEKNTKEFYAIVEEFRLKYRNSQEWKVLSSRYEEFRQKYNKK